VNRQADQRLRLIVVLFAIAFAVVFGRALYIQILQADALAAKARGQQNATIDVPTDRGRILDRNGQALAVDVPSQDLMVHPSQVKDPLHTAAYIAQKLGYHQFTKPKHHKKGHPSKAHPSKAFGDEVNLLLRRLKAKGVVEGRVLSQLDPGVAAEIMAGKPPGLFLRASVRRGYPAGKLASQLIGYTDSENSGADGAGIERAYNSVLAGRDGKKLLVNGPGGVPLDTLTLQKPRPGRDVQLTIDRSIQAKVQSVLDHTVSTYSAHSATAIVLDPRSGQVLAMATAPGYDNNKLHDLTRKQFQRSSHNMAVEYSYEPGSTFKVVTMTAALTNHIVTPQTTFYHLPYALQVGDRVIHDDVQRGPVTLTAAQILQQSSNVGTVTIARMVRKRPLYSWIQKFGFGKPTGIGLPAEAAPRVLPPNDWYSSSIGNIPIGQGISVTPMQMASMYSAIANGGVLVPPHVVESVGGHKLPVAPSRRIIGADVDNTLVGMLKGVVDTAAGTGVRARVCGYSVAGKTGTAQKALPHSLGYSTVNYVASFVGFLPASNPQVEVLVVVDSPRHDIFGGIVAAPAFQDIASFLTRAMAVQPDESQSGCSSP
jgi:cell division protein FtsI/penicillin-binding protein 2